MKIITTFILTIFFFQVSVSQTVDTIRVYNYLEPTDRWKLEIKNNKTFTFYTNNLFIKDDITSSGKCKIGDTTIQFICDTSKFKIKKLTNKRLVQFSKIPFIHCGEVFTKKGNYFIPRINNYVTEDSTIMPDGIYANYFRGDGFGSENVEIKQDGTYIFWDISCTSRSKEEGRWTLKNQILTFYPKVDKRSMLEWITNNRQLYLARNYLIGKKVAKTVTQSKKPIVTETFFYLSKESKYLND